jgi:hypothetical protein
MQLLSLERKVVKNLEKMENKKEMRNWLNEFNLTHPLVIAGPCRNRRASIENCT